jgi:glycosyltransferase involved in cell wall biosynthesis
LNGNVRFTGFLEGSAFQQATAGVDVVVMPSIWEETAGLAAMEQMMRGRVVLAADIGGLGEVVGDGGLKFRPFDADDLADKMERLAGSAQLRTDIGMRARERAHQLFSLPRMIDEHLSLFRGATQNE